MEQKVRELRIEVDRMINSTGILNSSREVSLCHTALQRSKAWLGEVLKELGTVNPYPNSTDGTNKTIEPQAEHTHDSIFDPSHIDPMLEYTQTAYVKWFRKVIGQYMFKLEAVATELAYAADGDHAFQFHQQSKLAMIEAKHWLGWELDRIRKHKEWAESPPNNPPNELISLPLY